MEGGSLDDEKSSHHTITLTTIDNKTHEMNYVVYRKYSDFISGINPDDETPANVELTTDVLNLIKKYIDNIERGNEEYRTNNFKTVDTNDPQTEFEERFEWIYNNVLKDISPQINIHDLIKAADFLMIESLVQACSTYVATKIHGKNPSEYKSILGL